MPSWRVHLAIGITITALLLYIFHYLDLWHFFITDKNVQSIFWLHVWVVALLGSLFPDFDYRKTRIRHALGPILGLFIFSSIIYLNRYDLFSINPASLVFVLFLFMFLPFIAGLVIPFEHHGKLHSITAAVIFALFWFGLELVIFNISYIQAGLIGFFGFIGYISHLILDLELKWI